MEVPATATLWILVGLAAAWDVAQRRIPNPLILTGLLLGLGIQTQVGGLAGLGLGFLGIAVAFAVGILPFALRAVGGGDVKITMVVGAFLGWKQVLAVILLALVAHGIVSAGFLGARFMLERVGRTHEALDRVPFAIGLATATYLHTRGWIRLT